MNNFDTLYQTLMLEFSEAAIKKFVLKFKDQAPEETIRKELADFERYKSRIPIKDPNQYDSWTSLYKAVSSARDISQTEKGTKKTSNSSESGLGPNLAKPEDANVLEIYQGDSEDKCILYGKGYSFCISRQVGGNMYSNYRLSKESTFYFIYFKDKSKNENDHIMVLDHTNKGYEWTFANNDTREVEGGWDQIVERYPILSKYKDILVNKKLDEVEKAELMHIQEFIKSPTLELFQTFDHNTKSKALKAVFNLPDKIFETLSPYLVNEFISIGPNLTQYQADSLKPNQIERYLKTRAISTKQLFDTQNHYIVKYNKHDQNIPFLKEYVEKKAEDNKKAAENIVLAYINGEVKDINLRELTITKLPSNIPDIIYGDFNCMGTQITSLEGAPTKVGGYFNCTDTPIRSLEGAPTQVGGYFYCEDTQITSLEGAPTQVGGDFNCIGTQITSLEGAPTQVGGNFDCSGTQITSLEGAPTKVGGNFYCSGTQITSLEGAPTKVGGYFFHSSEINRFFEYTVATKDKGMAAWGISFRESLRNEIRKSIISESRKYSQIQLLENLRDWFKPHVDKKGKKFKGWINCKTGGPCGRKNTSKGSYPACRPTKAQCKNIKGKMYKKKSSKRVNWKKKSS